MKQNFTLSERILLALMSWNGDVNAECSAAFFRENKRRSFNNVYEG